MILEPVYIYISAFICGGVVEDGELGAHEESLPVESCDVVRADLVPLLFVEAVVAFDLILCRARTEVSLDTEIDSLLLERNLLLDVSLHSG